MVWKKNSSTFLDIYEYFGHLMKKSYGKGRGLPLKCQGRRGGSRGRIWEKEMCSHTTFNVEDVMFVQGPAPEVGRVQLKSLKEGCPFLPQDETGAGLIFKPDRH